MIMVKIAGHTNSIEFTLKVVYGKDRYTYKLSNYSTRENMAEKPKELISASARAQRKALLGDDDATMVFETSKEVSVINTFDRMNLKEELLRGVYAYGKL